jgi:hypothetical protein|tara:strand:+ start:251 stop:610 length:360 start_codon:yes stop_codon:yes gene_type:complete
MVSLVKGMKIEFRENVFSGNYIKPKYLGERRIVGKILKESYSSRGQHTFTIEVINCEGIKKEDVLSKNKITRKGRNVYKDFNILEVPEDVEKLQEEKKPRSITARKRRYENYLDYLGRV